MNILRQNLAPISDKAWEEINEQSKEIFNSLLSARKFADVDGPKGWGFGSVTKGRVNVAKEKSNIQYGITEVLPLVESRVPFKLNIWELDNAVRGAEDIDLENLEKAAAKIAEFEERAIYYGLKEANIKGLMNESEYESLKYPTEAKDILPMVSQGINMFEDAGVEGPYALVVNPEKWTQIYSTLDGYPLKKQLENILQGKILRSKYIKEALLVSLRGGDFRLTNGIDLSVGYHSHTTKEVELYFTETFTFDVLDPGAVIVLK